MACRYSSWRCKMMLVSMTFLRYLNLNSLFFSMEKRSNETPGVPSNPPQTSGKERKGSHPSQPLLRCSTCSGASRVFSLQREHLKLHERLVAVRCWELQERAKVWNDRILQKNLKATPKTWALLVRMWRICPAPVWIGCS